MMPIILTQKVKDKRENLLKAVDVIRAKGFKNNEITDRLRQDFGIDFIDFRELFSSSRELCDFIKIDEKDTDIRWIS